MKTLCSIIGVALLLLLAVPRAQVAGDPSPLPGNTLLDACRMAIRLDENGGAGGPEDAPFSAGLCYGFLLGMGEMNAAYTALHPRAQPFLCPPREFNEQQGARIILRYLDTHPEQLHLPGGALVLDAFRAAFPCTPAPGQPTQRR